MKRVEDEEINTLTHAFKKLAKLQNGKKNRLKTPEIFQRTYEQFLEDFNTFLPKGKMIAWKEEDPLVKMKRKRAMFDSRVKDLGSVTYEDFCTALEMLESKSKTPAEVYKIVVELFEGRGDLIIDFEKFCGGLLTDADKILPSPLIDEATARATREPMRKKKFDDGPLQAYRCAFKKSHVGKVLEPKDVGDVVSPTPLSKGGPRKELFKNEPCKSTFNKDLLISRGKDNCNTVEGPLSKRVVRKRLNTDRPISEELEKRFKKLWKTYGEKRLI